MHTKPCDIPKQLMWEAYRQGAAHKGTPVWTGTGWH